jgi:hypothetical protein
MVQICITNKPSKEMEKNNDIFDQFKKCRRKSEQRSHPINEAIWDKIETNLDTKVLQKRKIKSETIGNCCFNLYFLCR